MKAEAALLVALADIGGMWDVMRVTEALTASPTRGRPLRSAICWPAPTRPVISRLPIPSDPEVGSGYVVLAMGKMGAGELNYSSDIDLIVHVRSDAPALADGIEPGCCSCG